MDSIDAYEQLDWNAIGEELRSRRDERQLTQEDVERLFNVPQATLSGWERGAIKRPPARLLSYCRVMGIDLDAIVREANERAEATNEENVIRLRPAMSPEIERLLPLIREIVREEIQQALNQGNQQFGRDGRILKHSARARVIPLVTASA